MHEQMSHMHGQCLPRKEDSAGLPLLGAPAPGPLPQQQVHAQTTKRIVGTLAAGGKLELNKLALLCFYSQFI